MSIQEGQAPGNARQSPTEARRIDRRDSSQVANAHTVVPISTNGENRPGRSPLLLDEWLEFNRLTFGLEPKRFGRGYQERDPDQPALDAVIYLDSNGRVKRPLRNPYIPVSFKPSPSNYPHRTERQWHEYVAPLVDEMRQRGVLNEIPFTPNIQDIRPWQWSGYLVNVRYTFEIDFPYDEAKLSKQVRSRLRRCERDGFRCERTRDLKAVFTCLKAAEDRQGYDMGLTLKDFERAYDLLGDTHFHAFAVYAPDGSVASSAITLLNEGSVALGWVGGTREEFLSSGAADLVEVASYSDLADAGATGIDLCGANMASIAAYKASLGARLVPYYSIEPYDLRRSARWLQSWWRFRRVQPQE